MSVFCIHEITGVLGPPTAALALYGSTALQCHEWLPWLSIHTLTENEIRKRCSVSGPHEMSVLREHKTFLICTCSWFMVVGVMCSLLPASMSEHLSMGPSCPPTLRTTTMRKSVLSCLLQLGNHPHVCHRHVTGLSPLARTCSRMWTFFERLHVWAHRFLCLRESGNWRYCPRAICCPRRCAGQRVFPCSAGRPYFTHGANGANMQDFARLPLSFGTQHLSGELRLPTAQGDCKDARTRSSSRANSKLGSASPVQTGPLQIIVVVFVRTFRLDVYVNKR